MQIRYEKKMMIVAHPSGHVDSYDETYMKRVKADEQEATDRRTGQVAEIDRIISDIKIST